jgi:PAS domain S-box-containing protein
LTAANAKLQAQADELHEAAEQLEQRVQARTAELTQANATLSQKEAALSETAARLHEQADLLNLTHDAIFVHDLFTATIRYWNRGAEERYGWSADEAIGRRSHTLTHTIFPEPLEAIYQQVVEQGRWEGELILTRRDGTQITVASRWALKRDQEGRPQAVLEINNDIAEQQHAQERLAYQAMLRRTSATPCLPTMPTCA